MRILYIANMRLPTEKAHGVQIMKMCEAFAHLGHEVTLVVPRCFNHIKDDPFRYYNVESIFSIKRLWTVDVSRFGKLGFRLQLLAFSKMVFWYTLFTKTDIVYSRNELPLFYAGLVKNKRNRIYEEHTGSFNLFTRFILKRAKKVVVISRGLKDLYVAKGVPERKIVVAHDAVDLSEFEKRYDKQKVRAELGIPADKKIVMYIGRLDMWKGVETLLEASLLLPDSVKVVIIGGESKQVETLSRKYPNVLFLGYRPYKELAKNQQAADVLVLPNTGKDIISTAYTSPLKLFAYMASSIPIVASDLPSIKEVIGEKGAVLVAPDDPTALMKGIEGTLSDSVHARHLALHAGKLVQNYSWDIRARTIIDSL